MRSSPSRALLFSTLIATIPSLTLAATSSSSCYYPSGNLAPSNDVPCNTDTDGHSACCSEGVACLSSGLCFDNGLVSRGSCTDREYADEACASSCTDFTPSAGAPIILISPAANGNVGNMGWCCGFPLDNGTCPQGSPVKIAAGTVYATAGVTSSSSSAPASSTTLISTLTSSLALASSSATPTQDAVSGNSSTGQEGRCEEKKNNDVAIGAGVGVPLGIAALISLGMWVRERRLRRGERLEGDLKRGMPMDGHGGRYVDGNGNEVYAGSYGVVNERKNPMELGDGRRPEELP
ncbi:hypothetical protein BKA64DRAFT_744362 [Cadophora sp. MPI-SDFR-AT-0126]|nr:hypothetical protein BKA64DRAFT_744362 [Leotiomycetes sp. MPI-SDFR-AT-0126]